MIHAIYIERLTDHRQMILADWLDAHATREGFTRGSDGHVATRLKYPSTFHLRQDLQALEAAHLIDGLAFGRDSYACQMLEPKARYSAPEKEETPSLIDDAEGTVYVQILQHWNGLAKTHPRRLIATRNTKPTAKQISDLQRAWRNEEFRKSWKRSARMLLVSDYHEATRTSFSTFISRRKESKVLWALDALRIFEEDNAQTSLPDARHLLLFPEPKEWRSRAPEAQRESPWASLINRQREAIYETIDRFSKVAV